MTLFLNILLVIGTFFFMEGVAWFTHKYIMHGFMWNWHKSHHTLHKEPLEKNDLFALVFSLPSITLIVIGFEVTSLSWLKFIGFGIMSYGIFYFIFHDIIVHRRINVKLNIRTKYLKRITNAHYKHHEVHTKKGAEAFGFLYSLKKYDEK